MAAPGRILRGLSAAARHNAGTRADVLCGQTLVNDSLHWPHGGSVGDVNEAHAGALANRPDPAADLHIRDTAFGLPFFQVCHSPDVPKALALAAGDTHRVASLMSRRVASVAPKQAEGTRHVWMLAAHGDFGKAARREQNVS